MQCVALVEGMDEAQNLRPILRTLIRLQGQPERMKRALSMVHQMDLEHFGGCTLFGECQEACPKGISIDAIARMNRDYLVAAATEREESDVLGTG